MFVYIRFFSPDSCSPGSISVTCSAPGNTTIILSTVDAVRQVHMDVFGWDDFDCLLYPSLPRRCRGRSPPGTFFQLVNHSCSNLTCSGDIIAQINSSRARSFSLRVTILADGDCSYTAFVIVTGKVMIHSQFLFRWEERSIV